MKLVFLVSLLLVSLVFCDEIRCPRHGLSINLNPGDVHLLEPIIKNRCHPQPPFVHQIHGKWIAAPEWKHRNATYRMLTRPNGCSKAFLLQIHVMSNNIPVGSSVEFLTKVWTRQETRKFPIGSEVYGSLLVRSPASGGSTQKTEVPTDSLYSKIEKIILERSTTTKKPSLESADDLQFSTTSTAPPVATTQTIPIGTHTTQFILLQRHSSATWITSTVTSIETTSPPIPTSTPTTDATPTPTPTITSPTPLLSADTTATPKSDTTLEIATSPSSPPTAAETTAIHANNASNSTPTEGPTTESPSSIPDNNIELETTVVPSPTTPAPPASTEIPIERRRRWRYAWFVIFFPCFWSDWIDDTDTCYQ